MRRNASPASFRDPASFVWNEEGAIFRHIGRSYREHYDHLLSSGLNEELVSSGLLVRHEEVSEVASPCADPYRVLKPEKVPFISYPYEWSFGQLKDAAMLTLEVQRRAMERGMSLRDCSAYNVQFLRGRPVFIDTASFEILQEGRPWIAYRQFCQHFLAPLALMAYRDVRLGALSRIHVDGTPVDLAAALLPPRARRSLGLFGHILAQAGVERRRKKSTRSVVAKRGLSSRGLKSLVWSLERTVQKLDWKPSPTSWTEYYSSDAGPYGQDAWDHKRQIVKEFLEVAGGQTTWDLGGNTGVFSREAAALGRDVVSLDLDPACVEINYRQVRAEREERILPLLCDLRNPTPAVGWANRERASLIDRGPSDVVMALAVVHHLAIGNNVPLPMIVEFFAEVGEALIVEFVPKSDRMAQELFSSRDDIFPAYSVGAFELALQSHFSLERRELVRGSERVMYLGRRKSYSP